MYGSSGSTQGVIQQRTGRSESVGCRQSSSLYHHDYAQPEPQKPLHIGVHGGVQSPQGDHRLVFYTLIITGRGAPAPNTSVFYTLIITGAGHGPQTPLHIGVHGG